MSIPANSYVKGYRANVVFDFEGFLVEADPELSVDKAIKKARFTYADPAVNGTDYADKQLESEIFLVWLVSFEYKISTTRALEKLDWMDLRPATLLELLALTASSSSRNIDYATIVALGTIRRLGNASYIPFVHVNEMSKKRETRLNSICKWGDGWTTDYLFAAVAK